MHATTDTQSSSPVSMQPAVAAKLPVASPGHPPLPAAARLHLAHALRSTPRRSYDWQVRRTYVSGTGDMRDAQLMAGTHADCLAGGARWAQATGEIVSVVTNAPDGPRGVWEFPPTA